MSSNKSLSVGLGRDEQQSVSPGRPLPKGDSSETETASGASPRAGVPSGQETRTPCNNGRSINAPPEQRPPRSSGLLLFRMSIDTACRCHGDQRSSGAVRLGRYMERGDGRPAGAGVGGGCRPTHPPLYGLLKGGRKSDQRSTRSEDLIERSS